MLPCSALDLKDAFYFTKKDVTKPPLWTPHYAKLRQHYNNGLYFSWASMIAITFAQTQSIKT